MLQRNHALIKQRCCTLNFIKSISYGNNQQKKQEFNRPFAQFHVFKQYKVYLLTKVLATFRLELSSVEKSILPNQNTIFFYF